MYSVHYHSLSRIGPKLCNGQGCTIPAKEPNTKPDTKPPQKVAWKKYASLAYMCGPQHPRGEMINNGIHAEYTVTVNSIIVLFILYIVETRSLLIMTTLCA